MAVSLATLQLMGGVTLVQMWWVAVWGITYLVIERVTGGSKRAELAVYAGLLLAVVATVATWPHLLSHL
jgi:hypothetical protein